MVGARLADGLDATEVNSRALEAGLVVNAPAPDTLRFLPALTVGDAEVAEALEKLETACASSF
jgi:acetylornithine/N-succinyldiaminopimelate aminotransferase